MVKVGIVIAVLIALSSVALFNFRNNILNRSRSKINPEKVLLTQDGANWMKATVRSNETDGRVTEFYGEMHYEGECSPNPKNPPPAKQVCTPPLHYHRNQVERFDVLEGEIAYLAQGKEGRIGKGEHITLPAGAPHTYWNSGKDTLKYKVTITATKHSYPIGVADDTFFENFYGLVRDQDANPLSLFYLLANNDVYIADLPPKANTILFQIINIISPLLGYKKHYPEYTTNYDQIEPQYL